MQSGYQEETERLRKIEYYRRWEQVKLSHPLRQLFWECTLRCNMECLHCGSDCRSSKTIADIPLVDFLRVLDEVACHVDPGRVLVNTVGGEPLVRKDIVECGREITRRGFPWGMVTNGYLLTADMLERLLKAGLCTIAVSLDGLEPEHNWLRGNKNSFYHAVEAIKLLVQSESLTWDVITCVNKRNLSRLDELKDLLVRLGVKHWRCTTIFPSGRAAGNGELLLDDEEMTALMEFIVKVRSEGNIDVEYGCDGYMGRYEGKVRNYYYHCLAGITVASILSNGDISGCLSIRSCYNQGNIYTDSFWKVWNEKFRVYRDLEWKRAGDCAKCGEFDFCQGNGMHLRRDDGSLMLCHFKKIRNL